MCESINFFFNSYSFYRTSTQGGGVRPNPPNPPSVRAWDMVGESSSGDTDISDVFVGQSKETWTLLTLIL